MGDAVTAKRNKVVQGWANRNHTQRELDGIEVYLNSGDPKYLPNMYKASHDHWFPKEKKNA